MRNPLFHFISMMSFFLMDYPLVEASQKNLKQEQKTVSLFRGVLNKNGYNCLPYNNGKNCLAMFVDFSIEKVFLKKCEQIEEQRNNGSYQCEEERVLDFDEIYIFTESSYCKMETNQKYCRVFKEFRKTYYPWIGKRFVGGIENILSSAAIGLMLFGAVALMGFIGHGIGIGSKYFFETAKNSVLIGTYIGIVFGGIFAAGYGIRFSLIGGIFGFHIILGGFLGAIMGGVLTAIFLGRIPHVLGAIAIGGMIGTVFGSISGGSFLEKFRRSEMVSELQHYYNQYNFSKEEINLMINNLDPVSNLPHDNNERKRLSYEFKDILLKLCKNPCKLKPKVGKPFNIEWFEKENNKKEIPHKSFIEIRLNGKYFDLFEALPERETPLPFAQKLFFSDHRYQIYSFTVSVASTTGYDYYFRRIGDEFYLLNPDPIPMLNYDYNAKGKDNNENFFSIGSFRGRHFDKNGKKATLESLRTNYKLEDNRLIVTEAE